MKLGAITNSWRDKLDGGANIAALIDAAAERGARHIELRQTCLGDCESGEGNDWRPDIAKLKALADARPSLSFNIAVAYPCLSQPAQPNSPLFQSMLDAAAAVAPDAPHLRMVDPARWDSLWETPDDIPSVAATVSQLTAEAARRGATLSMENSGQPIRSLAVLVNAARAALPPEIGQALGLCPDPTNQLRIDPNSDPVGEIAALPLDMIKIAHFKQTRNGEALPGLGAGDVGCRRFMQTLRAKGFPGPAILELPPHPRAFDNLADGFAYLAE